MGNNDLTHELRRPRISPSTIIIVGTLAVVAVPLLEGMADLGFASLGRGPLTLIVALTAAVLARTLRGTSRTLALCALVAAIVAATLPPAIMLHISVRDTYAEIGEAVPDFMIASIIGGYAVAVLAPATVIAAAGAAARASVAGPAPRTSTATRAVWLTIVVVAVGTLALRLTVVLLPDGEAVLRTTLEDLHLSSLGEQPWLLALVVIGVVSTAARHGLHLGWSVTLLATTAFHVASPTRWWGGLGDLFATPLDLLGFVANGLLGLAGHGPALEWDPSAILAALLVVAAGAAMIVAARLDRASAPLAVTTA
ncbi:hypothetical protein [Sanguibacter massiliensis]|uniref:hypothetical protein n=1 Tax=Sanguibacter massiliensis TaxID=1973217 RepID=UPI000C86190B|nr:hypothetical protein [Sanguibacter massiliensis]